MNYLKNENIYDDIIKFQLLTGLRIGETLAIAMNDINFNENYIDINKSVSRVNKEFIVDTPKSNNSYRRIYINKLLKEIINHNLKSNLSIFNSRYVDMLFRFTYCEVVMMIVCLKSCFVKL